MLQRMAQNDARFQAALQAFEQNKVQHDADMANRKRQRDQMIADEAWKVANCRRCPHAGCNMVINKLDGCDSMVCGRDYHGNIMQGGCGRNFNWRQALAYVADTGHHPNVENFDANPPARVVEKVHFEADGVTPKLCSHCSDQLQGPYAECLNCPALVLCIRCQDGRADAQVAPGERRRGIHLSTHLCRVVMA